jgi:signal transduction histidine kinase
MRKAGLSTIMKSGWMTLAIIALLAAIISLNWYFYIRIRDSLDEELGLRLQAIAALVASSIDAEGVPVLRPKDWDPRRLILVTENLQRKKQHFALSNIVLLREDGFIILSLDPIYLPDEYYPNFDMDGEAVTRAISGSTASTRLYRASTSEYMKAGYSPVYAPNGEPLFAVGVEASVDFLHGLRNLRAVLTTATVISVIGIALFVSFVVKATQSLVRARESLVQSESLATMGRMAAGIAHEIRNPLFIIQSSAERLKKMHPEDSKDINTFIIEEVSRLDDTLREYLLFARNEPAPRGPLDLTVTLGRSVRMIEESTMATGIELVREIHLDEAPFHGEEKRLQQSFLNILLNAQQALQSEGTIKVSMAQEGKYYILVFEDDGPGIPEKTMERLFEPFYTTKNTGSGLGLAIVKKVIEEHNGHVEIKSERGAGTKVTVKLPVAAPDAGLSREENLE